MSKNLKLEGKNFIIKGNALVEARYKLSLQESQIVLWLLTQIKQNDEDFKSHKLNVTEFANLLNLSPGRQYAKIQEITEKLMRRVLKIYDSRTQKLLQVSWLSSAEYEYRKGYVMLEFSPKLKPHLLQLKSQFTKINIIDTLKLKSIYAIRVLELLLQYIKIGFRKITTNELREYCGIEENEYKNYFDLKRKVIEKAKNEITNKTEYQIDYTEVKESRKVVAIEWQIKKKNLTEEKRQDQIKTLENELNYKFVLIRELMDYGYSKSLATKIIKENEETVIKNALSAVSMQLSRNQVKNPGAMLRVAIKEKWHPERYIPHKQNKAQDTKYFLDQNEDKDIADSDSNNHSTAKQFDILNDLSKMLKKF